MDIDIRFVDKDGFVQECFSELVQAKDTTSKTLHECISTIYLTIS